MNDTGYYDGMTSDIVRHQAMLPQQQQQQQATESQLKEETRELDVIKIGDSEIPIAVLSHPGFYIFVAGVTILAYIYIMKKHGR